MSAVVMQMVDNTFRVDVAGGDIEWQRALRNRARIADIATRGGRLAADAIHFRQGDDLDCLPSGRTLAAVQRYMPVIDRQIKHNLGLLTPSTSSQQFGTWLPAPAF